MNELRECPYCAESIKSKAKLCRFCNKDVTPLYVKDKGANDQIIKILLWIVVAIVLLIVLQEFNQPQIGDELDYFQFIQQVQSDKVSKVTIDGLHIRGEYKNGDIFTTVRPQVEDSGLMNDLLNHNVQVIGAEPDSGRSFWTQLFFAILPVLIIVGVFVLFMRQMQGGGRRPVSVLLAIGIFFIPLIFSWFTLREGYTKKAKIISFVWLMVFFAFIGIQDEQNTSRTSSNMAASDKGFYIKKDTLFCSTKEQLTEQVQFFVQGGKQYINGCYSTGVTIPVIVIDYGLTKSKVRGIENNKVYWVLAEGLGSN